VEIKAISKVFCADVGVNRIQMTFCKFTCFTLLSFDMWVLNYVLLLLCKAAIFFLEQFLWGFLEN